MAAPLESLPLHDEWGSLSVIDYLALLWPAASRRAIEQAFARGQVRSGGRPIAMARTVAELRDLTLHCDSQALKRPEATPRSEDSGERLPPVLFEDDRFVVVEKPAGMSVVPARDREDASLLDLLVRRELRERASGAKSIAAFVRFRVVHRLDRWTSGLVIIAKTAAVERQLAAEFEARRVDKEYHAIVAGVMTPALLTVNCPIAPGRKGRMRAELRPDAKPALTTFEVVERFADATWVRARPLTGRTHQIRVHAWAAGHPLLRDPLYGPSQERLARSALADLTTDLKLTLHARRYGLPAEGPSAWDSPRVFEAPLPAAFRETIERLRGE